MHICTDKATGTDRCCKEIFSEEGFANDAHSYRSILLSHRGLAVFIYGHRCANCRDLHEIERYRKRLPEIIEVDLAPADPVGDTRAFSYQIESHGPLTDSESAQDRRISAPGSEAECDHGGGLLDGFA